MPRGYHSMSEGQPAVSRAFPITVDDERLPSRRQAARICRKNKRVCAQLFPNRKGAYFSETVAPSSGAMLSRSRTTRSMSSCCEWTPSLR